MNKITRVSHRICLSKATCIWASSARKGLRLRPSKSRMQTRFCRLKSMESRPSMKKITIRVKGAFLQLLRNSKACSLIVSPRRMVLFANLAQERHLWVVTQMKMRGMNLYPLIKKQVSSATISLESLCSKRYKEVGQTLHIGDTNRPRRQHPWDKKQIAPHCKRTKSGFSILDS